MINAAIALSNSPPYMQRNRQDKYVPRSRRMYTGRTHDESGRLHPRGLPIYPRHPYLSILHSRVPNILQIGLTISYHTERREDMGEKKRNRTRDFGPLVESHVVGERSRFRWLRAVSVEEIPLRMS